MKCFDFCFGRNFVNFVKSEHIPNMFHKILTCSILSSNFFFFLMIDLPLSPSISFSITLGKLGNEKWEFGNERVILKHSNTTNNPYFQVFSNDDGFLILKSRHGNALECYYTLCELDFLNNSDEIKFPIFVFSYSFVFYDAKKQYFVCSKDQIGLSSILYSINDFVIASYGVRGIEIAPGFTIFYPQIDPERNILDVKIKEIKAPPFVPKRNPDMTLDDAMNLLIDALVKSVDNDADVLFSGGLDSTVMAAATALNGAKHIKLINFCADPNAPDFVSAQNSWNDLKNAFPETEFELKQVVYTAKDMSKYLDIVKQDIVPVEEIEMNLNIAMTILGGQMQSDKHCVMSGLGPDELFCGYMSMKNVQSPDEEVVKYLTRLYERNGGRDDRIANQLGKYVVCPYMSTTFIEAALSIPIEMLVKPELPRGIGEKWILRQVALKFKLNSAAERPKQAMQFGSKVAKAKWH